MFEHFETAPPDAILGLTEAFRADPNPMKINLSAGVYQDARGRTPVLESVKLAAQRVIAADEDAGYLAITGRADFQEAVQRLLFGAEHEIVASKRIATAQTPGGTGALRVAADFIRDRFPGATVWLSEPTWPNHPAVFQAAGLPVRTYPYFDPQRNALDAGPLSAALAEVPPGDVVLLHGCCHNPTGVDPDAELWREIADLLQQRGALPLIDFAYQGLGRGLEEDAAGLRTLARPGSELLIAASFSKNFGLYKQRVGALSLVAADAGTAERAMSHIKRAIRANYSNPPAFGSTLVSTILADDNLRSLWWTELQQMRQRILDMRVLFVRTLAAKGVARDFSFLAEQLGMFSFSGLNPQQVARLRERYSIYIVGSGRISVAGMNAENMDPLCTAIAEVLAEE